MTVRETEETTRLRMSIEQTRAEMSGTINAIQERLSPQHIADEVRQGVQAKLDEAKATVRDATVGKAEALMRDASDTMQDVRFSTMDTVKSNPIPAAMVVAGLGWLFMNHGSRPSRERYEPYTSRRAGGYRGASPYESSQLVYDEDALRYSRGAYSMRRQQDEGRLAQGQRRVGEAVQRVQEGAGGAVNQAQDAMGGALNRAQETAGAFAGRTAYAADRVEDRVRSSMHNNPLAVGALVLAAGVATGFALPQTERENQLMGEARDELVEQARGTMSEAIDKVQRVSDEVAQGVQQKTTEKAREAGLTSGQ